MSSQNSLQWDKFKFSNSEEFFADIKYPVATTTSVNLTQKSLQKNICIKYDGAIVARESIIKEIEILDIRKGMEKYFHLIEKYFKDLKNKNTSANYKYIKENFHSGVFIYIPDNSLGKKEKIYLYTSIGKGDISDISYNLIIVGKGNNIEIVSEYLPIPFDGKSKYIASTDIFSDKDSNVEYINISGFASNIDTYDSKNIYLYENSKIEYVDLLFGGMNVLQKTNAYLLSDNSKFNLNGLAFSSNNQIYESKSLINNIGKGTEGKILYKNILDKKSKLSFDGLIKIEKGADYADSYLEDHTIILSDEAQSDSVPGLEIEANEVKASHGATVGKIDEDELFYVMSRGLEEKEAKRLILSGFIDPILNLIEDNSIKDRMTGIFLKKFGDE